MHFQKYRAAAARCPIRGTPFCVAHSGSFHLGSRGETKHSPPEPFRCIVQPPPARHPMAQKHIYVLGINAYDHDVAACLLRDGEIAFAIEKERITRQKHATGFFQEVVDYVLAAEGITLDDVDLVVRNCYVFPVEE